MRNHTVIKAIEEYGLRYTLQQGLIADLLEVSEKFNAIFVKKPVHAGSNFPVMLGYKMNYIVYFDPKSTFFIFIKSRDQTNNLAVLEDLFGLEFIPHHTHSDSFTFKDPQDRVYWKLKGYYDATECQGPTS